MFILEVDHHGLCGYSDWELPTAEQLRGIVNYKDKLPNTSRLDPNYFPHDMAAPYLTGSPDADNVASTWCVDTGTGFVKLCNKGGHNFVRLVRSGE